MCCSMLITVIPKSLRVLSGGLRGWPTEGMWGGRVKHWEMDNMISTSIQKTTRFLEQTLPFMVLLRHTFSTWYDRVKATYDPRDRHLLDVVYYGTLIVTSPDSRNGIRKCVLFINHSVYSTFYSSPNKLQHRFEGCLNKSSIMPPWIPYFVP